jgi:uncharacterized membrane protein YdjX (TVP38/TMEM64 family)
MLRAPRFLLDMDSRAWRAVAVSIGLFASVALIFLFGKTALGLHTEQSIERWLTGFSGSPWGLPAAILVFTAAAFVGAPQFILIAACVVAFGPWLGFLYGWIATVVSAAATFYAGRMIGARSLERFGGQSLHRLSDFVGRNAFAGSFIIRNVPSAPFAFVNMAFGVSRASFPSFILGCALGVLPKTALVALFGRSFMAAATGRDWKGAVALAAIGVVWLALMLVARHFLEQRIRSRSRPEEAG